MEQAQEGPMKDQTPAHRLGDVSPTPEDEPAGRLPFSGIVWIPTSPELEQVSRGAVGYREGVSVALHLWGEDLARWKASGRLPFSPELLCEGFLLGVTEKSPLTNLPSHHRYYRDWFERLAAFLGADDLSAFVTRCCVRIGERRGKHKREQAERGAGILFPELVLAQEDPRGPGPA
jgi:hypothetical protein